MSKKFFPEKQKSQLRISVRKFARSGLAAGPVVFLNAKLTRKLSSSAGWAHLRINHVRERVQCLQQVSEETLGQRYPTQRFQHIRVDVGT